VATVHDVMHACVACVSSSLEEGGEGRREVLRALLPHHRHVLCDGVHNPRAQRFGPNLACRADGLEAVIPEPVAEGALAIELIR
jgi:hypothetical protein